MSRYTELSAWCEPLDGIRYRSTKPIIWEVGRKGSGLEVAVPAGTDFDVSVPRWARWLIDPHDTRFLKAACMHDMLLAWGWDRLTSAAVFGGALKADGVSAGKRLAMFLAVAVYRWT